MQTSRLLSFRKTDASPLSPPTQIAGEENPVPIVKPMSPPALTTCLNCQSPNVEQFCPRCGQERGAHIAPIREMVQDAASEFLHWEGRLMRTLRGLLRPGFLTTEYLAGRRAPYLAPFKMYLWAIGVYVLAFTLNGTDKQVQQAMQFGQSLSQTAVATTVPKTGQNAAQTMPSLSSLSARAEAEAAASAAPITSRADLLRRDDQQARQARKAKKLRKLEARMGQLPQWIFDNLTWVSIAAMPLCAALLHLLYHRQRRLYVEQLVTILYNESAMYLLTAPLLLVGSGMVAKGWLSMLVYPLYYFVSFRRVYRTFPRQTASKTLLKMCLYFVLVSILLMVVSATVGIVVAVATLG